MALALAVFYRSIFSLALAWWLFYYSFSDPTTGRINNFDLPNRLVSYSFHFHLNDHYLREGN